MSTNIKLKRSAVAGKQPNTSILELGELAINTFDGKIYFKKDDGAESIVTILEVTEDNLFVDSSSLTNASANNLSGVLSDLDAAITTSAGGGLTSVATDSTINGDGTGGSPLSVANNGHFHTANNITDFELASNNAIDARVTKSFVDALDVDADTLDSLDSSQFLRSDADDTASGNISFTGVSSFENDVNFVSPNGNNTITMRMLDNDTLTFNGDSGQLFSITDSLTGTIFSVNDITGIPLIEADADATIRLAEFDGNVLIGTATDNGTDKLQINGSVSANTFIGVLNGTANNASYLDNQLPSYYLDWTNTTNKPDPNITVTLTGDVTGSANATLTDLANGTISVATTIQPDSVALGTDTTGDYVASISGTADEIEVTGTGEGATVTIGLPDNVTIGNNLTVTGDLVVSGNTVSVNTTNLDVEDSIITLNKNQATPLNDIGFLFQRYSTANTTNYNIGFAWDETADKLTIGGTSDDGSTNDLVFDDPWLTIDSGGNVGIGNTAPTNNLTVQGNADFAGNTVKLLASSGGNVDASRHTGSFFISGNHSALHSVNGLVMASNKSIGWNDQTNYWAAAPDTKIIRDGAAGVVALQNGTNAQTLNIYNTYTDASNYERTSLSWNANTFVVSTEAAGTGSIRDIGIVGGNVGIGTVSPSAKLDIVETWNEANTTFTAVEVDITDTASASSSLLLDLKVNTDSKFNVTKSGDLYLDGLISRNGNDPILYRDSSAVARFSSAQSWFRNSLHLGDNPATGNVNISLSYDTGSTANTSQQQISSFTAATYASGKFVIQAKDTVTGEVHSTELLIVHDGTTASSTEYATIHTGASPLATYDVDISGGNVRILATAASTNSTTYKVSETLITV